MTLPAAVMDWRHWLRGLIAAAVGGGANAVATMLVDPGDFNLTTGLGKLESVAVVGALLAAAMYLKQSPLPDWDGTDRREQVFPAPPPLPLNPGVAPPEPVALTPPLPPPTTPQP